jgi:hypothetical protein
LFCINVACNDGFVEESSLLHLISVLPTPSSSVKAFDTYVSDDPKRKRGTESDNEA